MTCRALHGVPRMCRRGSGERFFPLNLTKSEPVIFDTRQRMQTLNRNIDIKVADTKMLFADAILLRIRRGIKFCLHSQ